jgi:hypothetical protein
MTPGALSFCAEMATGSSDFQMKTSTGTSMACLKLSMLS